MHTRHPILRFARLFLLVCLAAGWPAPRPAQAAAILVTTTAEAPGASGDCTLGEAIQAATTNTAVDACPAGGADDVILLQPGAPYFISVAGDNSNGPSAFATGGSLTIDGRGAVLAREPSTPSLRFFLLQDGRLTLKNLTLRGWRIIGADGANAAAPNDPGEDGDDASGGALYNFGLLVLDGVRFEDNAVQSGKGGNGNGTGHGGAGGFASGGAIQNAGEMRVEGAGAVFTGNQALGGEGGFGQSAGGGGGAVGSAVSSAGTLEAAVPILFEHNLAQAGKGGPGSPGGAGGAASGVLVNSGQARLAGATFRYNTTLGGRGGPSLSELGPGGGAFGGVLANSLGGLTLTHGLIFSNTAVGGLGSQPGDVLGGVLYQPLGGDVRLAGMRVISNTAAGGDANAAGPQVGGGAFGTFNVQGGAVYIEQSAIVGNTLLPGASDSTADLGETSGGGLFHLGGAMRLANTTVAYNTAAHAGALGATAPITLTHVTVAHNTSIKGASAVLTSGDYLWLYNSVIAHNSPGNCSAGNQSSGSANLQYPGDSCGANVTIADPLLGPLTEVGGTPHLPLLAGSPALGAAVGACPPSDQRGFPRPIGAGCDLGAIEGWGALFLPAIVR